MTAMSAAVGASVLAHGLHYAMVLAGLWGLAALLLPHTLTRLLGSTPAPDEHARRVADLRAAVAVGAPGIAVPPLAPAQPAVPATPPEAGTALPLAVVATAAAAGIHAAVAPPHLREWVVSGAFFLVVALAQLAWTVAAQHPSVRVLRVGVALNLGLVGLWVVTRTVGLPVGPLAEPHPVGAWDVVCVGWELLAAAACLRALHDTGPDRARAEEPASLPGWFEWRPVARAAVGAAAVSLALLTVMGGHS